LAPLVTLHLSQQCGPIAAFLPHPLWQGEANCHAGGGGSGVATGVPGRLSAGDWVQAETELDREGNLDWAAALVLVHGECWAAALRLAAASALMARCSHSGPCLVSPCSKWVCQHDLQQVWPSCPFQAGRRQPSTMHMAYPWGEGRMPCKAYGVGWGSCSVGSLGSAE